jgi:hypothetical protein
MRRASRGQDRRERPLQWRGVPERSRASKGLAAAGLTAAMHDASTVGRQDAANEGFVERLKAENVALRRIASQVMHEIEVLRSCS